MIKTSKRYAVENGKQYLIAPLTLIVPGVLHGSKGPLYYPAEEIAATAAAWNGKPLVVYHPHRLGFPVPVTHPGILDKSGIGTVRNARVDRRGKLRAEGWFEVERTRKVDHRVYAALVSNRPIELSTGLYTENEECYGVYNGRYYTHVARNYRPDHLAILPDQVGACSLRDGCGVLVNKHEFALTLQNKLNVLILNRSHSKPAMHDND